MRKDFYYAAAIVAATHSGLVWMSALSHHIPAPAHHDPEPPTVEIVMPAIEPDPEPVKLEAETPKTEVKQPPTLTDVPIMATDDRFVVPVRPAPPTDAVDTNMTIVPPNLPTGPGTYGRPFDINELSQAPDAIARPAPNYPFEQKRSGIEGTVTVEFVITKQGQVINARAVSPEGSPFAGAAVQGVYRWKFHPGIRGGAPVATRMQVPIVFSLNKD